MNSYNPQVFRQYDIRGAVGSDLTQEFVTALGRAIGTYFRLHNRTEAIVGCDNRSSSPQIRKWMIEGLTGSGCDVLDIGEVVTPVFYYSQFLYGNGAGVMITGSHNPPDQNGFKIYLGEGTIYGDEIQKLRSIMEDGEFTSGSGNIKFKKPTESYIGMLCDKITLGPRKTKVVVDCGNGTAGPVAPELFKRLGCDVIPLYCDSNSNFPNHHPDPVKSENLADLKQKVIETGADLGIAFDGDADRIGVVDEKGKIIWGDYLMILFWREIMPKYPESEAIVEVKCSQALVDEIIKLGGRPMFYKTGHSLIKAKMREIGAVFTGEMSGHMFFADEYYGYDDALYAAARLLRILSNTDRNLSEMLADVSEYYATEEIRIDCPDSEKFDVVRKITEKFKKTHEVIDIDGARVIFPGGWGLVRCSNTQPVIVTRCEARSQEELAEICSIIGQALTPLVSGSKIEWGIQW